MISLSTADLLLLTFIKTSPVINDFIITVHIFYYCVLCLVIDPCCICSIDILLCPICCELVRTHFVYQLNHQSNPDINNSGQ